MPIVKNWTSEEFQTLSQHAGYSAPLVIAQMISPRNPERINQFLTQLCKKVKCSKIMVWFNCLGTLAYIIAYFNFDQSNSFVHIIGDVVFFLDIIYLYLLYSRQGKTWVARPAPKGFNS